ncbi:MAG: hypothetical protein KGM42_05530 [Hyphomicrobiales bacterium]|nr:hypothetical protein [Hyphomicrobiales bacterium]
MFTGACAPARAQIAPELRLTLEGRAEKVYGWQDRCEPIDVPDVNARAFRAADGATNVFALHFFARRLRGPDLLRLKIDCHVALDSHEDADPAKYDGRRYIVSTWTNDGIRVAALVHDEYHADVHPGRCAFRGDLECWWNTILAFRSTDSGADFSPSDPLVVAATPFTQDVGQGRHRGFFNPSNMFGKDGYVYAFVSTTGWTGQEPGECLIRTRDPMDSASWRGWDGRAFTVRWRDPYAKGAGGAQPACAPIEPFGYPVGSVVRHRATGLFVGVWEAPRVEGRFPFTGLYYATSRDLLHWSGAALLAATPDTHQPCGADGSSNRDGWITSYPSLLDDKAKGRNYDDVGDASWLFYARIKNVGCAPNGERMLMRQRVVISPAR